MNVVPSLQLLFIINGQSFKTDHVQFNSMNSLFLGLGELGWRTMGAALRESPDRVPGITPRHMEIGTTDRRMRSRVPLPLRRAVNFSFWTRASRLDAALTRAGPVSHVHCFGHLLAVPDVIDRHGATYSVTLDTTERLNLKHFTARAAPRGRNAKRWIAAEAEILAGAEFICSTSEWARAGVIDDYGIDPSKVIHNPFPVADRASKREPGAKWLTFIGDDIARKGGDRLVEWHQENFAEVAELHLVSNDPLAARYTDYPGVVCHGGLPNSVVRSEILPRSRLIVLPTLYDHSPIVLTEACAAGVPAVASEIAGIPELIVDGQTGFTIQPDDSDGFVESIRRLLLSDELSRNMGMAAAKHYKTNLDSERSIDTLYWQVEGVLNREE